MNIFTTGDEVIESKGPYTYLVFSYCKNQIPMESLKIKGVPLPTYFYLL